MHKHHLFLGTYTRSGGKGIYRVDLDAATGALSTPVVAAETSNPSFVALSPDKRFLFAVSETDALASAYAINPLTLSLTPLQAPQPAGGKAPCHLVVDQTGRTLVVAHYHTGVVASLPIGPDGKLGRPGTLLQHRGSSVNRERQDTAHAHSVTISPDNRHVIVCDLGLDKIFTYRLDPDAATLTPAEPPFITTEPGAGPRHAAFSRDGRHVFVINEMGGSLVCYAYDATNGSLTPTDTQSTLPAGFTGENTTAEVRVHPNGEYVYGSNRGHDSLVVFRFDAAQGKLSHVETVPVGGKHPRNFALSPDGKWLVAANQNSNDLTVFRVDASTGRLTKIDSTAIVSMPVCVAFFD